MTIVDFENVKVTTMTVIVDIVGTAVIDAAFPLLPITRLELKKSSKSSKKFKIPWPGPEHAGAIFSSKFAGITRGIIKTSKNKSFRNSVGIDICTSTKNISAKLCKNKIHITGSNSQELAVEAANHIINHLKKIQEELDYINENIHERDEVIKWLTKETKGECFIINEDTHEILELGEGEYIRNSIIYNPNGSVKYEYREVPFKWEDGDSINPDNIVVNKYGQPYYRSLSKREKREGKKDYPIMIINDTVKIDLEGDRIPIDEKGVKFNKVCKVPLRVMEVTSVKFPNVVLKNIQEGKKIVYPKNIDSRIANFLISYIQDYAYHHVLAEFFDGLKHINKVYLHQEREINDKKPLEKEVELLPLGIGKLSIAMINYSYSIQMNVDRWKLTQLIDGYEKEGKVWRAVYNNTTDHHVTITVPYEMEKGENIKRKESKSISWMVYKSGNVTQSGPSPALMRDVYYDFMNFINSVRDEVKLRDNKPFNIKYKPVSSSE